MTHLTVHILYRMAPEQLIQIPEIMPRLESLEIHNHYEACYIPSCMFVRMEGLRSLSLTGVDVDRILFEVLASLEHLTALQLCFQKNTEGAHSVRFHAETNCLHNLLFLRLDVLDPYQSLVLEHLSGVQLSRLQVLEFPRCKLDDSQKNYLFSRFPSLRRFSSR